jgi:hypothetical protein
VTSELERKGCCLSAQHATNDQSLVMPLLSYLRCRASALKLPSDSQETLLRRCQKPNRAYRVRKSLFSGSYAAKLVLAFRKYLQAVEQL